MEMKNEKNGKEKREAEEAINSYRTQLCKGLDANSFLSAAHIKGIFSRSERERIETEILNQDKIMISLDLIIIKDDGFAFIRDYLRENNMLKELVKKLDEAAGAFDNNPERLFLSEQDNSKVLNSFTDRLIDFYTGNFRSLERFGDEKEPIESVWVNLQLEKDTNSSDDYRDIFIRMSDSNCRLAVIKGQPGSGKTTLMKKIAYDWGMIKKAEKRKNNLCNLSCVKWNKDRTIRFDLVLAAPLRSIFSGSDPLEMAVHYLSDVKESQSHARCVDTITRSLRESDLKILVVLDGLDEYDFQPNSLLAKMFGSASQLSKDVSTAIQLKYDLLVTSRPYACRNVNENLFSLKWEIIGFTEERQHDFVKLNCKTTGGRRRALKYLQETSVLREISQIPLLLLFVCFLSDMKTDIPDKLTKLYETCVWQLIIRSKLKARIKIPDNQDWRKFGIVKSLGRLALLGAINNKFEFNTDERKLAGITDESFASGLLLFKSDPFLLDMKADFTHRSFQEFFAAAHSVDFWTNTSTITDITGWPEDIWPIPGISDMKVEMLTAKMLRLGDSQFCRFYFGLLSDRSNFLIQTERSLEDHLDISLIDSHLLFCLSNSLADRSDDECFSCGQIVNNLVAKSFAINKSGLTEAQTRKNEVFRWTQDKQMANDQLPLPKTDEFRLHLQLGLKLNWLGNSPDSFYLAEENTTEAKMMWIWLGEENLRAKIAELHHLKKLEWLLIFHSGILDFENLQFGLEVIRMLPKCRNCLILDGSEKRFIIRLWLEINPCEEIEKKWENAAAKFDDDNPEFLFFGIESHLGEEIFTKLSSLKQSHSGDVSVDSIECPFMDDRRLKLLVARNWSVWASLEENTFDMS